MDALIELLRQKGCKITPQRRAVIKALQECGSFPTAQKILDFVKASNPDMGLDTVYRNLNLLTDIGVVNQIHVRGREGTLYEIIDKTPHHHHMVCLGCGKARCLEYCPVSHAEIRKIADPEFEIVDHSLEIYGYCRDCKASK